MAFKHVLTSTLDPKIPLKEMSVWDDTEGQTGAPKKQTLALGSKRSNRTNKRSKGSDAPLIQINDFDLSEARIDTVIIDETEFLPKITVIFEDSNGWLDPVQFPNKNPILSIYIKSLNEKMKPIRNDYIITSIKGSETKIIKGELFIPGLYTNVSKSYGEVTSNDAMFKTCEDLGLGFQANQISMSDTMKWVNPNWNSREFMKHVMSHSYSNDQEFHDSFIDKYYHFNFVNVNLQLEQNGEFDNTLYTGSVDYDINDEVQVDTSKPNPVPSGLIQKTTLTQGTNAIQNRHLVTSNGDILLNDGFRKRIYYYDYFSTEEDPIDKLEDFYIQPIESTNEIGREKNLKPINDELNSMEVRKWVNVQYKNSHQNFVAAKTINYHNLSELKKINLKVGTEGVNFNSVRGMRIPVAIYDNAAKAQSIRTWDGELKKRNNVIPSADEDVYNPYLSGIYYIMGSKYIYEKGQDYKTELVLSKRDWVPNPKK